MARYIHGMAGTNPDLLVLCEKRDHHLVPRYGRSTLLIAIRASVESRIRCRLCKASDLRATSISSHSLKSSHNPSRSRICQILLLQFRTCFRRPTGTSSCQLRQLTSQPLRGPPRVFRHTLWHRLQPPSLLPRRLSSKLHGQHIPICTSRW